MTPGEMVVMVARLIDALDKGPVQVPPETHRRLVEGLAVLRAAIAETVE